MSHLHERKERKCLNCSADLYDRYCHKCGQENVEPKESVWHLFVHFFNDITHFDGKFFSTIKLLIKKPGFVSEEYMKGRRASYLNPIRLYLFISFVLFFLVFTFGKSGSDVVKLTDTKDSTRSLVAQDTVGHRDSLHRDNRSVTYTTESSIFDYNNVKAYDSVQRTLPAAKKDSRLERYFNRRIISVPEYVLKHPDTWMVQFANIFKHSIPKMLFISIPFFAFLLWLLYIRSRKNYYFVAHGIFTIHLYCAIFLLLIVIFPLEFIDNRSVNIVRTIIILLAPAIYLFIAMKRFYKQGVGKTLLKCMLLLASSSIVFFALLICFMINALLAISNGAH